MDQTQISSVTCNHCGAPIEIAADTNFVTCSHCGSKLQVHRSASSVYTEVLQSIDQRTQRMEQDLDQIKRQNEIERLDREWSMRRDEMLVRDKNGSTSEPSAFGSIFGGVIAIVAGIAWMVITSSTGAPGFFPLFGLLFIFVGIFGAIGGASRASRYQDAQRSYEQQRSTLMRNGSDSPPR